MGDQGSQPGNPAGVAPVQQSGRESGGGARKALRHRPCPWHGTCANHKLSNLPYRFRPGREGGPGCRSSSHPASEALGKLGCSRALVAPV